MSNLKKLIANPIVLSAIPAAFIGWSVSALGGDMGVSIGAMIITAFIIQAIVFSWKNA